MHQRDLSDVLQRAGRKARAAREAAVLQRHGSGRQGLLTGVRRHAGGQQGAALQRELLEVGARQRQEQDHHYQHGGKNGKPARQGIPRQSWRPLFRGRRPALRGVQRPKHLLRCLCQGAFLLLWLAVLALQTCQQGQLHQVLVFQVLVPPTALFQGLQGQHVHPIRPMSGPTSVGDSTLALQRVLARKASRLWAFQCSLARKAS
mmetsp:Transcript_1522/g.4581  ORF Transcript_1522/g.4581 Transcript_1522/m.4581 type:complete len:204 (-) Transcript_1522:91-702(-)